MTAPQTIAVLGLGRMGSAIATRLTRLARLADGGHDWDVVGWTRSGRTSTGAVEAVGDVSTAVAKADVVVLALFDGHACRQVVDQISDALRPEAIVWNASTIAPAEASELARRLGRPYVHAPVLGSVPAVAAGELEILAAGDQDALERARPALEALGKVHRVEDAATAAALKLVANSSLAGAVLALRETLRQAQALGLRRAQVLDVLELGQLGGLVARKRAFLAGPLTAAAGQTKTDARQTTADVGQVVSADSVAGAAPGAAEFTIGALAKDMALLAEASHSPLSSAAELAGTPADPSADIAVAATVPSVDDAVLEPLRAYMRGHATGDPAHFRVAFLPSAHIEGIRDGAFVSWRLDEYCDLFDGLPAADEAMRSRRIDAVSVHGSVAAASMTLWHGVDIFTDIFLLMHVDGLWRIANKAYHRAPNRAAAAGLGVVRVRR